MPHKLPEEIAQVVKEKIVPGYKMWWIRGIVLGARLVDHGDGWTTTLVQVGDLDAPGEGYDVSLEGKGFEFAEGDLVSLFGHEPIAAGVVTSPRFLIHHNTGTYTRAYDDPNTHPRSLGNYTESVNRLACKVPAGSKSRLKRFWIPLAVIAGLSILTQGLFLLVVAFAFMCVLYLGIFGLAIHAMISKLNQKGEFARGKKKSPLKQWLESSKYQYANITSLYEDVAVGIHRWIRQNPDKEKGFVVVARGRGTQGRLVD